ncbi:MAG: sigma-54-dependent Fis family transcriptional regulator, partial [Deltaproteobacteria bacterium]|nr:sigma-54-dependent Fis family transcriptional regulator [Deltaproteobacteria bacterium]
MAHRSIPPDSDDATRQPSRGPSQATLAPPRLALSVLWHADAEQVGRVHVTAADRVEVSRRAPVFTCPRSGAQSALDDGFVSRGALGLSLDGEQLRIDPAQHGSSVLVDGVTVTAPVVLKLGEGRVIELADRVALLAHVRPAVTVGADRFGLVGDGAALDQLCAQLPRLAATNVPVLVRGESGSGKELVARALHERGPRASGPFVALNLAALAPGMAASELFGHVRGAFTGAMRDHAGAFVRADRGTLFLDEVGDAPVDVQLMLLRTLETREVAPVGATRGKTVDVRVVAATDAALEDGIASGQFRNALLHRLAGYVLRVPPLRERPDDLGRLLRAFLREELRACGAPDRLTTAAADPMWLPTSSMLRFVRHAWPGNVRELRNVARQIVLRFHGEPQVDLEVIEGLASVSASGLAVEPSPAPASVAIAPQKLDEATVLAALEAEGFQIGRAATRLGVSRSALYERVAQLPGLRTGRTLEAADI